MVAPGLALPCGVVISTNQFKNGTHIEVDGTIFRIVELREGRAVSLRGFLDQRDASKPPGCRSS